MSTAEAAELTPRPSTGSPGSGSSSASASPPKSTVRRLEAIVVKIVEGHRQDGATSHKVLRHFAVTDDLRTKVLKILSSNSSRRFHKVCAWMSVCIGVRLFVCVCACWVPWLPIAAARNMCVRPSACVCTACGRECVLCCFNSLFPNCLDRAAEKSACP